MQETEDKQSVQRVVAQDKSQLSVMPPEKKVKVIVLSIVFIIAISALFFLRGGFEGGSHHVKLGESQTVSVDKAGFKGKALLTVDSIKKGAITDLEQFNLKADQKDKTPFYVTFTIEKQEGDFDPSDTYSFSSYKWYAKSNSNKELMAVSILTGANNLEGCKQYSSDAVKQFVARDKVTACQVFLSDGDDIAKVTYRVNTNISYSWEVKK